jgi:hypothetical protein
MPQSRSISYGHQPRYAMVLRRWRAHKNICLQRVEPFAV